MRKSIVTVLAALSASGMIAAPASAAEDVSVNVSYADLNLASPAGAARLHQRIVAAVEEVCAKPASRDLKANAAWQKCKIETLAAAREAIPAKPALAQVAALF